MIHTVQFAKQKVFWPLKKKFADPLVQDISFLHFSSLMVPQKTLNNIDLDSCEQS